MRITWTCTLRWRCQQRGSHAVSVRVRISGDYWRVYDGRHWTTKMRITWTCTLRWRCQQRGSHAVSVRVRISGDYWRVRNWRHNRNTKLKMRIPWTCTLRMKAILRGSQRFMREETSQINCRVSMGWYARNHEIWILWNRTLRLPSMMKPSLHSTWRRKSRDSLRVSACRTLEIQINRHCILGLKSLFWWILHSTQGKICRENRRESNCRNVRTAGIRVPWNCTLRFPCLQWWFQISVTEGVITEGCQGVAGEMRRRNGSS